MNLKLTLLILLLAGLNISTAMAGDNDSRINFYSFEENKKEISEELVQSTDLLYRNHPDFGRLPASTPCKDCFEELEKRRADSRYFIAKGSKGTHFYRQQSLGAINYRDEDGNWRDINAGLQSPVTTGIYKASQQPNPVTIDVVQKYTAIQNGQYTFEFNRDLQLVHIDSERNMTPLGAPNWSNYSAGSGGIRFQDFYPGVDLEMIVYEGRLKTNFVLNSNLNLPDGWLVMIQHISAPRLQAQTDGAALDVYGRITGEIPIVTNDGREVFRIGNSLVFDADAENSGQLMAGNVIGADQLSVFIPVSWLNEPSRVYPVTIDPLVTASGVMAQAAISGSGFSDSCFGTGGCYYPLSPISVPTSCTVTGIHTTFSYQASNACAMKDGSVRFKLDSCYAPSDDFAFTVPLNTGGMASINESLFRAFSPCIPAPQCASYNLNFSMDFIRCNIDPTGGCTSNCISAASAWVVTVEGHTVEINSITPSQLMCTGASAVLEATASYGVAPYSFMWSPGALPGDSVVVSPGGSQVYACTATDACGITATATTTVTVSSSAPASVSITPNGIVCGGNQIPFTAYPYNGGSAPVYSWYVNGTLVASGSQSIYTYAPNVLGDSISVELTSSSVCLSPGISSAWVVTQPTVFSAVSLTVSAPPPYCVGQTVVLTAGPTGGGASPTYGWLINNVFVAWTPTNVYHYTIPPGAAKSLKVALVSDLTCVSNDTVLSISRTIVGQPLSTPFVTIAQSPPGPICSGTSVTFTANYSNAGTNPGLQWLHNGVPVSTTSSYSFTTSSSGDILTFILTSTANCPATLTDTTSITLALSSMADTAVSLNVTTLTANAIGASYQWLYCDSNMMAIPGASGQAYTAVANGNYAVSVTQGTCIDTSNCWQILQVGIGEISGKGTFLVYPNPAGHFLTLRGEELSNGQYWIRLSDVLGRTLLEKQSLVTRHVLEENLDLAALSAGLYFVTLGTGSQHFSTKVMKE